MVVLTGKQSAAAIGAALFVTLAPSPADAQTTRVVSTRQEVAVARTGEIPSLGAVTATLGWDQRLQVFLRDQEFVMTARSPQRRARWSSRSRGTKKPHSSCGSAAQTGFLPRGVHAW